MRGSRTYKRMIQESSDVKYLLVKMVNARLRVVNIFQKMLTGGAL